MSRHPRQENPLHMSAREILASRWQEVQQRDKVTDIAPEIAPIIAGLQHAPHGRSSSYRFVLPTQLVAKLADPSLDSRCIQATRGTGQGNFDARSLASKVIVPFFRDEGEPLGPSADPYVNNPLRVPEISQAYRGAQTDKERWDQLGTILSGIEERQDPAYTQQIFDQVLLEIRRVKEEGAITYAIPQRISLEDTIRIVTRFLQPRTGGRRLQAVSVALFRTLKQAWGIYDEVSSAPVNAADIAAGRPADIICKKNGITVLVIEVKDQVLTLQLLEDKIRTSRTARIKELLFLIGSRPLVADQTVEDRARREFTHGLNIYLVEATALFQQLLAIVGEEGRQIFLDQVGLALNEFRFDYTDRQAWASELASL